MVADDPEDEAPLDPAAERLRRKLARLLIVSGGIMFLGLIAVFAAIVYKLGLFGGGGGPTPAAGGAPVEASIGLPPGARLVAAALDGERALLTVEEAGGAQTLMLVELGSGRVLGRYALEAE